MGDLIRPLYKTVLTVSVSKDGQLELNYLNVPDYSDIKVFIDYYSSEVLFHKYD